MKPTNRLVLALALALGTTAAGCSTDPSNMGGDDDGGGDNGGGGDHSKKPLDATGRYAMHSTFDLATNMPGTAGTVVNTIIAATDDSDDPTHWLLDQIIAQLPDGSVKSALNLAKSFVAGYLNQRLLSLAPDFVTTMVQVGHDFGDIAKHVGLNETLELTRSGTDYLAVHTITGAHVTLGNQDIDYAFATYRVSDVVVNNVAVTMDATGQLTIAAHTLPVAYGQLLRLGLDAAIIPLIDPAAHNLNDLFAHEINCLGVGTAIANAIKDFTGFSIGSTSVFAAACTAGLHAGANFVYSKIDAIDGTALQFGLNGSAKGLDKNNDRTIDSILTGTWTGTLSYGATPTPLAPSTFFGERM
ncbi:MAG TPA: hypothetical protein VHN14_26245 [Kofleriaceae bacterium]|jgi:hypothetical protein|nr:hypothetical protein [Kofleriaceae bacterium]